MASNLVSGNDPPWQQLRISKGDLKALNDHWSLLHLLHHRSKNQHRHSSWYRHFNMFRKQLHAALDELDPPLPAGALPSLKFKTFSESMRKVDKRLNFWAETMVLKWYQAFTQLLRDTQFAVIGLTLLATLGRLVKILDVLPRMKEVDSAVLGNSLEKATKQSKALDLEATLDADFTGSLDNDMGQAIERDESDTNMDEFGTVVERGEEVRTSDREISAPVKSGGYLSDQAPDDSLKTAKSRITKAKRPSKKRKKGDEIDDLFSGLL